MDGQEKSQEAMSGALRAVTGWKEGNKMELISCPFCNDGGFDPPGLKDHLIVYCEVYRDTKDIRAMHWTDKGMPEDSEKGM